MANHKQAKSVHAGKTKAQLIEELEAYETRFGTSAEASAAGDAIEHLERGVGDNELQYRTLAELSPDAVIVQVGGRIAFANQSTCLLFGAQSPDELIGLDALSIVDPA